MTIKTEILAEDCRTKDGVEYVTVTGREIAKTPLLQMFDYGLRRDEMQHKGKLVGKVVELQIENIRAIFGGRPQMSGRLVNLEAK